MFEVKWYFLLPSCQWYCRTSKLWTYIWRLKFLNRFFDGQSMCLSFYCYCMEVVTIFCKIYIPERVGHNLDFTPKLKGQFWYGVRTCLHTLMFYYCNDPPKYCKSSTRGVYVYKCTQQMNSLICFCKCV